MKTLRKQQNGVIMRINTLLSVSIKIINFDLGTNGHLSKHYDVSGNSLSQQYFHDQILVHFVRRSRQFCIFAFQNVKL